MDEVWRVVLALSATAVVAGGAFAAIRFVIDFHAQQLSLSCRAPAVLYDPVRSIKGGLMRTLQLTAAVIIGAMLTPAASASTPEGRACVTRITGGKYTMTDWENRRVVGYGPEIRACLAGVKAMYEKKRAAGH